MKLSEAKMYLKFGFELFRKNIILNLIIIFQLSFTILLSNLIVSKCNGFAEILTTTKNFPALITYLYMPGVELDRFDSRIDKTKELFNKYADEITIEQTIAGFYNASDNTKYELVGYGQNTLNYLSPYIKSGEWFKNVENVDYIPCISIGKNTVGDEINISMDNKTKMRFKVIGTMATNAYILRFWQSSNSPGLESLFERNYEHNATPILIFNQSALKNANISVSYEQNSLVYINSLNYDKIRAGFQKHVWFVPFYEAQKVSNQQFAIYIERLLPIMICIFFIGIVAVVCMSIVNTLHNMRIFSIYYICGMNWISSIVLCLSYILFNTIGIALLSFFMFAYVKQTSGSVTSTLIINQNNYMVTVAIVIISILAPVIAALIIIKREYPVRLLKES